MSYLQESPLFLSLRFISHDKFLNFQNIVESPAELMEKFTMEPLIKLLVKLLNKIPIGIIEEFSVQLLEKFPVKLLEKFPVEFL